MEGLLHAAHAISKVTKAACNFQSVLLIKYIPQFIYSEKWFETSE